MVFLDNAWPSEECDARAVSADGSTVVGEGIIGCGYVAFRWTAETGTVTLSEYPIFPYCPWDTASDVSADGSLVVGSSAGYPDMPNGACIWDESGTMRNIQAILGDDYGLDLSGWSLSNATGISDDGSTIVGSGTNPLGHEEAWVAVIPEPSGIMLALTSLLGWLAWTWRTRCRRWR